MFVKRKLYTAIAAMALAGSVQAQSLDVSSGSISGSNSNSKSNSDATAISKGGNAAQGQDQGQSQKQNAAAIQGQDASNTNVIKFGDQPANTTSHITNDTHISGTQSIKSAPAIGMGILAPTTPCSNTYQLGVSGMGFGVGAGGSVVDLDCTRREYARILWAAGAQHAAIGMLCQNEELQKVAPVMCRKAKDELTAGQLPAQPLPTYPSTQPLPPPPKISEAPAPAPSPAPVAAAASKDGGGTPVNTVTSVPPAARSTGGPQVGDIQKGNDGVTYRFTGSAWVKIVNSRQPLVPDSLSVMNKYDGREIGPGAPRTSE